MCFEEEMVGCRTWRHLEVGQVAVAVGKQLTVVVAELALAELDVGGRSSEESCRRESQEEGGGAEEHFRWCVLKGLRRLFGAREWGEKKLKRVVGEEEYYRGGSNLATVSMRVGECDGESEGCFLFRKERLWPKRRRDHRSHPSKLVKKENIIDVEGNGNKQQHSVQPSRRNEQPRY
jgi:hypothetical protein